jgi:lysylphosphatidylglycerol synthetase-like protein (DUF2156 family)
MSSVDAGTSGFQPLPGPATLPRPVAPRPSQTHWASIRQAGESDVVPLATRMELLHQHGDFSLAYSTAVQPLLEYFGDGRGYIAWRRKWGVTFALGDPVCSPDRQDGLLREFMAAHRGATFVQCSKSTARILESLRYRINEIGVDTRLDLASWTFGGKQREWLRYADNWMARRDYRISEGSFAADRAAIEEVSEEWRRTRTVKRKEVRFLNRPIMLEDEPGVRRFLLHDGAGKLQAFVVFDPLYQAGKISGYVTCMKRRRADLAQYAERAGRLVGAFAAGQP